MVCVRSRGLLESGLRGQTNDGAVSAVAAGFGRKLKITQTTMPNQVDSVRKSYQSDGVI